MSNLSTECSQTLICSKPTFKLSTGSLNNFPNQQEYFIQNLIKNITKLKIFKQKDIEKIKRIKMQDVNVLYSNEYNKKNKI